MRFAGPCKLFIQNKSLMRARELLGGVQLECKHSHYSSWNRHWWMKWSPSCGQLAGSHSVLLHGSFSTPLVSLWLLLHVLFYLNHWLFCKDESHESPWKWHPRHLDYLSHYPVLFVCHPLVRHKEFTEKQLHCKMWNRHLKPIWNIKGATWTSANRFITDTLLSEQIHV